MKILEVIGEDKYIDQLDSDINSTIIAMMANDVGEISMDDFQKKLKEFESENQKSINQKIIMMKKFSKKFSIFKFYKNFIKYV